MSTVSVYSAQRAGCIATFAHLDEGEAVGAGVGAGVGAILGVADVGASVAS